MIFEGTFVNDILMQKDTRPYPVMPQETSGIYTGTDTIYRYSLKSSDYPTITIDEPIFDGRGNVLPPGHYELALSDDRNFLLVIETKELRAVIPVIKIEEDMTEEERLKNKSYRKQLKKEAEERKKINAKRARTGMPPDVPEVYMKATFEYVKEGDYYLIRYENGTLKAWGVIKG